MQLRLQGANTSLESFVSLGGVADFDESPDGENQQYDSEINQQQDNECFHGAWIKGEGAAEPEMIAGCGDGKVRLGRGGEGLS